MNNQQSGKTQYNTFFTDIPIQVLTIEAQIECMYPNSEQVFKLL